MTGAFVGVFSILLNVAVIAAIIFGLRKLFGASGQRSMANGVQGIFQYALTFGLLMVVAVGLSGLLASALGSGTQLVTNQSELARNVTFTVVGLPLLAGMIVWIRKRFHNDPNEGHSIAAVLFVLVASISALAVTMASATGVLYWAFGVSSYRSSSAGQFIVWSLLWLGLWLIQARVIPRDHNQIHYILGSIIGLVTAGVGLVRLIAATIDMLGTVIPDRLVSTSDHPIAQAAVNFLVGALVWLVYWLRQAVNSQRSPLWLVYVLLVGVGGGLVMALVSTSTVIYRTLVWFIGQPIATTIEQHFRGASNAVGSIVVGLLVWWYHRTLLGTRTERTEVQRIYSYLIAGVGLIASGIGFTITLVAIFEALIKQNVLVGGDAKNTLLASATAMLVGVPVWLIYWRGIQRNVQADPDEELSSPTRRTYLYALFGVGGISSVIALLAGVYQLLNDLFNSRLNLNTVRDMRFAVAVLVSTASVALYHWLIYRQERDIDVRQAPRAKRVTLIGILDPEFVKLVIARTHARIDVLERTDDSDTQWPIDAVVELIEQTQSHRLVVVNDASGPFVIPIAD